MSRELTENQDSVNIPINRRRALRTLLASTMAGTAFSSVCAKVNGGGKKGKVLVVGAGAAGLAAAQTLQSEGFQVLVLEGRDRMGGRIWTDRSMGSALDLGASWIHGSFLNPITKIARQNDIRTKKTNYDNISVHDFNGAPLKTKRLHEIEAGMRELLSDVETVAGRLKKDVSVQAAVDKVLQGEKLDAWERRALNWRLTTMEMNAGVDFDQLSLKVFKSGSGFMGGDRLFPGGYDQIVNAQAKGLDVRLNQRVRLVRHDKNGVVVETNRGKFRADRAVITLPLGVLKSGKVRFAPELPAFKRRAIAELGMGLLNKIALKFNGSFWPANREFLGYMSQTKGEFATFMSWKYYTRRPILLGFLTGRYARSFEELSDKAAGRRAFDVLQRMYGARASRPADVRATRWSRDGFAYGSYSYLPVGVSFRARDALAVPVGRLFFAGEATHSKYPATVHGAYLSGVREARRMALL